MVEFSIEPRKTAVIAIDLQNCFVENSPYAAPSALRVVEQLNALTMHYRAAGSTIIWTRHVVRAYHSDLGVLGQTMPPVTQGVIDDGTASSALHPNVEVQAGDIVLNKPQFGAFSSTGLESILRARGIDTVVIGGIATNFCCETTAREAHAREFRVMFLKDGTATFDMPDTDGGVIPVTEVQRIAIATVAFGFGEVLSVADACMKLPKM